MNVKGEWIQNEMFASETKTIFTVYTQTQRNCYFWQFVESTTNNSPFGTGDRGKPENVTPEKSLFDLSGVKFSELP